MAKPKKLPNPTPPDQTNPPAEPAKPKELTPKQQAALQKYRANRSDILKFKKDENDKLTLHYDDFRETTSLLMVTMGAENFDASVKLLNQILHALPAAASVDDANAVAALMFGIQPQDTLEGLLATHMLTVHTLAMECSRRAMVKDQHTDRVDQYVGHVNKLMRTFTAQMEALSKYRNKGQQTIQVQHVQVNQGGQAIVGNVQQGGWGMKQKNKDAPHAPRDSAESFQSHGWLKNGNPPGDPTNSPRCGAKSKRTGKPCQQPAIRGKNRCRLHGGLSTGPMTAEGLEHSRKAQWKHGWYSEESKREQRHMRELMREYKNLLLEF